MTTQPKGWSAPFVGAAKSLLRSMSADRGVCAPTLLALLYQTSPLPASGDSTTCSVAAGPFAMALRSEWRAMLGRASARLPPSANGPGGPDNPLGARALYLGDTLYC